jgi:hypothetical protein
VGSAVEGAAVSGAVEGDAVLATTAIIGACEVGVPVGTMPPEGESVSAAGRAVGGDLVDCTGVLGDTIGARPAAIGAGDVGGPVARLPPVDESGNAVGEAIVGDLVDCTGVLGDRVGTRSVVGIGAVVHTAIWHCMELGTHGCPVCRQKPASTDDSTPCTTIVHVAVNATVPSPQVAVQDACSRCTHHPTAATTDGLRWVQRTGLTLHA